MQVIGICRFSLIGRGDWKTYQGQPEGAEAELVKQQALKLFTPERMEARLASFQHLTLASLQGQTDPDFRFIVLASELMPAIYRDRLQALCDAVPQVVLRFFGVSTAKDAQQAVFRELRIRYPDVLQFRLDDDDCLCLDFVALMRQHCQPKMTQEPAFAASLAGAIYSVTGGEGAGVYYWPITFLGVGAAVRHPSKSIFEFGHFALAKRFPTVLIPDRLALVTHNGTNDTNFTPQWIERRGLRRLAPAQINQAVARDFPFLTDTGKSLAGLDGIAEPVTLSMSDVSAAPSPRQSPAIPQWLSDLASTKDRKGFYIAHDQFALQHTYRGSQTLYVSFDNLASIRADTRIRDPWGYGFAASSGWSSLGALSFRPNWFRVEAFYDEMRSLADRGFFERFQRVVFSGTSMGAYAACAFSSLAPGSTVVAFSPQSTLASDLAGWDLRYPAGSASDWSGPFADAAQELGQARRAWIVYDPDVAEDSRHVQRFTGQNVTLLRARYSSHFTAQFLRQVGVLSAFVRGCAADNMTEARFYRLYRTGRHHRRYLGGVMARAVLRGEPVLQDRLAQVLRDINRPGLAKDLEKGLALA